MARPDERRYSMDEDVRPGDEADAEPERSAVREESREESRADAPPHNGRPTARGDTARAGSEARREDRPARRSRGEKGEHAAVVGLRLVDWVFYVLYALLGLRFLLALLAASEEAGFTQLVHALTDPFLMPFQGIVARPTIGGSVVDFPVLVAIVAYIVLHLAIRGLIRTIGTASAPPRRE